MASLALITGLALLATLLYWELRLAEGVHLGAGVVVRLYDLTAHRYEAIKQFDQEFEDEFLGYPLTEALVAIPEPLVLDVAAGTCRLARTVLRQTAFDGRVVGVDMAARMLHEARRHICLRPHDVDLVRGPADRLPFPDDKFDAVTCLEALEFMPAACDVLHECVRVLRSGGLLIVSNRIGPDARWLWGKTFSRPAFRGLLTDLGLQDIYVYPWQEDYDLAWARK